MRESRLASLPKLLHRLGATDRPNHGRRTGPDDELFKGSCRVEKDTIAGRGGRGREEPGHGEHADGRAADLVLAREDAPRLRRLAIGCLYGFSPVNVVKSPEIPRPEGNAGNVPGEQAWP